METDLLPVAEINDQFNDYNFKLIFLESALRSMIHTGNLTESHVGDGLAAIMLSLIREYQELQNIIDSHLRGLCDSATSSNSNGLATTDGKGQKT